MKRRAVKISVAIFVLVGISLGLLVALTRDRGPEMSFDFLDGKTLTARIKRARGGPAHWTTREVYSFIADFNDVIANAEAELMALGFKRLSPGSSESHICQYTLRDSSSTWRLQVKILGGTKVSVLWPPDRYKYNTGHGWVSVEVARRRLRPSLPHDFLDGMKRRFRRPSRKTPPRNP